MPRILDRLYDRSAAAGAAPESNVLTKGRAWPREGAAPAPRRTHVITDGDTLAGLAARYLGDEKRSAEIFEANRGVLSDPEVLPLGVELKIPARE